MHTSRVIPLAVVITLAASLVAQTANSANGNGVKNVKIGGTATFGYAMTLGDFNIYGRSVGLYQVLPQGLNWVGTCTVGTDCAFTLSPYPASGFCSYCRGYSNGGAGTASADYLQPDLIFTATGFYPGGDTLTMHVNVTGTVTGYKLINCAVDDMYGCELGPAVFTVRISGHGSAEVQMQWTPGMTGEIVAYGANLAFSGVAHIHE